MASESKIFGSNSPPTLGNPVCAPGEVITEFDVRSGKYIDSVSFACSDGAKFGPFGGGGGSPHVVYGPMRSANLRAGALVDGLFSLGGGGGSAYEYKCPSLPDGTPQYLTGIFGRSGKFLESIGFKCGPMRSEYCLGSPDDPMCRTMSTATLNAACKRNMGAQICRSRKDELDASTVQLYCATHLDDPLCSCYMSPPEGIPQTVAGLPQCWSQACSVSGYIPPVIRGSNCPNIKICKQDLGATGSANKLTGNVVVQDCSDTSYPSAPPVPSAGYGIGTGAGSGTSISTPRLEITAPTDYTMILIVILVIFVALIPIIIAFVIYGESPPQQESDKRA